MNPLPEPAVILQGPAVRERISGYFYHITIDWAVLHFMPRAKVRHSSVADCQQLFAFVTVANLR